MIIVNGCNYYKAPHLECCSSPRSTSGKQKFYSVVSTDKSEIRRIKINFVLTFKDLFISESCIEIIELNFYFHTALGCLKRYYEGASKGIMNAFKAFIKLFEAPQRSAKIKIQLNFFTLSGIGTLRANIHNFACFYKIVSKLSICRNL